MKLLHASLVSFCLLGAAHLANSQMKESTAHPIAGYLDPSTGKFTTRLGASAAAHANPEATAAATNVLFREDFKISITNYDQSASTAVCSADISSGGDSGNADYEETASVTATASGGTFSCDVPVLAQWLLQTPTTDTVYAFITVTLYTPSSQNTVAGTPTVYRSSTRQLVLTQPGNTQTATNNISISL